MINTITFNPSVDYMVDLSQLEIGEINRSSAEYILPGGKGINVSIILNRLGVTNKALGFVAGFTGDYIEQATFKEGVIADFIKLKEGFSRINVKITDATSETGVNGSGAAISSEDLLHLNQKIATLTADDILVLAGAIPASLPDATYRDMMEALQNSGTKIVVDATKDLLMNVLEYRPFLIKPNHIELAELFDETIKTKDDAIEYARKLRDLGARNVLVSMADEGAVLLTEDDEVFTHSGIAGKMVSSVGAGDSMVAGFIAGYVKEHSYEEAFKMGIAAGTATAFSDGLATKAEIDNIYRQL
ncbi:1-phosphofructokinase [Candidatus Epulonipiscium viviparus]|uniref:1-phosphofructokinase n=2 Tax=Candidatus Epulonipiscium viviparus TaxID=420336 RepID=UPI0027380AAA|nr:1-phosphofructokinase [Candidatus Epulopiscium viviparus]